MRLNRNWLSAYTWACEGRYLLFHLLVVLCFVYPIEYLHIELKCSTIFNLRILLPQGRPIGDTLLAFLPTVGDALVLSLPLLLFTRRRWVVFIPLFLFDLFGLAQSCYARVYEDVMPYSSFLLFDNVNGVLLNSVRGLLRWRDVTLFVPTLLLLAAYLLYFGKQRSYPSPRTRWITAAVSLVVALAAYGGRSYQIYHRESADRESPWTAFITPYNYREYLIYHGVVPYTGYVLVSSLVQSDELTADERATVDNYLVDMPRYTDNRLAVEPGRNLILIVVESMNSWMLDRTVGGVEIMPRLNRLLRQEGTFAALHLIPQVKDGRSSDGHLMFNTGLLPARTGATAVLYGDNRYPALGHALKQKGYRTLNIVCDRAQDWNQVETSPAYGFDTLYDKSAFESSEILDDSTMLARGLAILRQTPQPFFAQLVTISTHAPNGEPVEPTALSQYPTSSHELINTMEAFYRLDRQLGQFIDSLQACGLYDRSVVAIVSDHDELGLNVLEGRTTRTLADREVALLLLNTPWTVSYESVAGQIDIYPTLLDVMGCNEYPWKGLGYSLLRTPVKSAVYWDRSVAGDTRSPLVPRQREAWNISNLILTGHYFESYSMRADE